MLNTFRFLALSALACATFAGCGEKTKDKPKAVPGVVDSDPPPVEGGHSGKHGGTLIELGQEEYHAELVIDEKSGLCTIYLMDGALAKDVPIPAKELTINLTVKGKPEAHVLAAKPQTGDPAGQSSRFETADKTLHESLEDHDTKGRLAVEINGKPYSGDVKHQH
ncbi:MAG: hypothetical protein QM811_01120 [Pirellulales bacterium]